MGTLIRNAKEEDLCQILEIDREAYSPISKKITATEKMMLSRIKKGHQWFFVAEVDGVILGYLSLQPTSKSIDVFESWEKSTDAGTLNSTYDESGEYVYGVSLTISKKAKGMNLSNLLFERAARKIICENKKLVYFSGRMPGYIKYKEKMTAEEYFSAKILKKGESVSLDPQIRMYESFGLKKVRLVKNGFEGDRESDNFGVVFAAKNPAYNLPFPRVWGFLFSVISKNKFLMRLVIGG